MNLKSNDQYDQEVDLLVIGAGAGGMTSALVGALGGMSVLLCESSDQVGGTAATSAGSLWIPGNTQSRRAGYKDTAEDAQIYLSSLIKSDDVNSLLTTYLQYGPAIIDDLECRSEVRFGPCGRHPDYLDEPGAAIAGRAITPIPFDGRLLGSDFHRVRPPMPEFMLLGGMMVNKDDISKLLNRYKSVANLLHGARLVLRYASDRLRYKRGTRLVMGNALVARLFYSLREAGAKVSFRSKMTELICVDSKVVGAEMQIDGSKRRIRARRGVVLACGGFAHNVHFRGQYMPMPTPEHSLAVESNLGDGIDEGLKIGAKVNSISHMTGAFWSPTSVTVRPDGSVGLFPHLLLDRAKPGVIAVNQAGRRFVNEGVSYHHFVEAMFESHKRIPCMPAYLICNADFIFKYGLGAIHPGTRRLESHVKSGYLHVSDSIEGLARKIQVVPEGLTDSIARNNLYAATGVNEEFGKGSTELNRFNGDALNSPNPCLGAIDGGPFCAMAVWPAEIACSTGLSTDEDARVIREDGLPIPGLYACGNDMASIMRGTYPGPGTTLGPAIVFGYRAAKHCEGLGD